MQQFVSDLPDLIGAWFPALTALVLLAAFGLCFSAVTRWLSCRQFVIAAAAAAGLGASPIWPLMIAAALGTIAGGLVAARAPQRGLSARMPGRLIGACAGVLAGYALGLVLRVAGQSSWRLLGLMVILLVMALLLAILLRALINAVLPWISRAGAGAWPVALRFGLPLLLICLVLVRLSWTVMGQGEGLARIDGTISQALTGLRNQPGDAVMIFLTSFGDWPVVTVTTGTMALWLLGRRQWRIAIGFAFAVGAGSLITSALKLALAVPRPNDFYRGVQAFSFPSGHSSSAMILYGLLIWFAWRLARRGRARRLTVLFTIMAATIAFSRLYLGAHWPSDVLGGFLLGAIMVVLFALIFRRSDPAGLAPAGGLALTMAAFVIFGSAYAIWFMPRAEARYSRMPPPAAPITVADWAAGAWRSLPARRSDQMAGPAVQQMTLQWAGTPGDLAAALAPAGWAVADRRGLPLSSGAKAPPVLPLLQDGQLPVLMLTRAVPGPDGRQVLFGWDSGSVLTSGQPILIVTVTAEAILHPLPTVQVAQPADQQIAVPDIGLMPPARSAGQPPRQVWLAPLPE